MPDTVPPDLLARLGEALGPAGLVTDPALMAAALTDWRGLYHGRALALARPADTDELSAVARACHAARVKMVPQGGNTGMSGGGVPREAGDELLVSLSRMRAIGAIDPDGMTVTVGAGAVLAELQQAAADAGFLFPLSLGSQGSAQIGGLLSTNAGGNHTLRYGNARDLCLGIEVVLADGTVLPMLRALRKDNTGYALRQIFIGAEGTLGFISRATLRVFPGLSSRTVLFAALPSVEAALALLRRFRAEDEAALQAFEYLAGSAVEMACALLDGVSLPLGTRAPHYCLVELGSPRRDAGLVELAESVLAAALEEGTVLDATIAASGSQAAQLWRLREEIPEAQRRAGPGVKNDVAVPIPRIPALLARGIAACQALMPGVRAIPFGHLGDGNIHFNFVAPEGMDAALFEPHAEALMHAVNDVVRELGGSFSAEHGIGRLKTAMLAEWRAGPELDTMRRIKAALDPHGLMNPGKVLG
ncbi:MAG: FAD-binding oxidoreductase [Acetobacteraceae bacterium]|nr:FAD-binding oxidoreductase [Acetobacteraceae bacterium]